jgi:hypothetical protein
MSADIEDEDSVITICAGPPLCTLMDEAAVSAQVAGCESCKRIVMHPDGSETVIERVLN